MMSVVGSSRRRPGHHGVGKLSTSPNPIGTDAVLLTRKTSARAVEMMVGRMARLIWLVVGCAFCR
jgi:hypothetical protein